MFEFCLQSILFPLSMSESLNLLSWLGCMLLVLMVLEMSPSSSSTILLPDFDLPTMMPLTPCTSILLRPLLRLLLRLYSLKLPIGEKRGGLSMPSDSRLPLEPAIDLWYVGHTWDGCSVAYSFCSSIPCLCNVSYKKQKGKKKKIHFHKKVRHLGNTQMCVFPWSNLKAWKLWFYQQPIPIYIYVITFTYNLVRGIQGQL